MSDFPPVLTPERIDAMLSGLAEVCFAGVVAAGDRMQAAVAPEPFACVARALQSLSRNLRQTIAMKHRFDKHQAQVAVVAAETARVAQAATAEAAQKALRRHSDHVRDRLGDLIWDEHEDDEAEALYEEVDAHLDFLIKRDPEGFRQTGLDDLVAQVSETYRIGAFRTEPKPEPKPPYPPPKPRPKPRSASAPMVIATPAAVIEPEPWPEPPGEPWPEPYIPPWEKLKPGHSWPGSSGI